MPKAASKEPRENEDKMIVANSQKNTGYEVNQMLFDEAHSIKHELNTINERLSKMDQHRSEVSDEVFLRVQGDYMERKRSVQKKFEGKRKEISKELLGLYTARKDQESELTSLEKVLEEAKFRHFLGEFSDSKYKKTESEQNTKISAVNDVLAIINQTIEKYEDVIGGPLADEPGTDAKITDMDEEREEPPRQEEVQEEYAEEPLEEESPKEPIKTERREADLDELDNELDLFLESSKGDYFLEDEKEEAKEDPEAHQEEKEEAQESAEEDKAIFDDSLSGILRNIPLEDQEGGEELAEEHTERKNTTEETKAQVPFSSSDVDARLVLLSGDFEEEEIMLGENISIGRSPSNDITLKEAKVSRQHAAINFMNGNYVLVDLKSSNGVFVNAKRIEEHILSEGDIVQVGSYQFKFTLD